MFVLGNEMISFGTQFPCQARYRTWTHATLNIPMHNCIPVCYDISFKSVQVEFALPYTYMCVVMSGKKVSLCVNIVIFHCICTVTHSNYLSTYVF